MTKCRLSWISCKCKLVEAHYPNTLANILRIKIGQNNFPPRRRLETGPQLVPDSLRMFEALSQ